MSPTAWIILGMACAIAVLFALALMRANGEDVDADKAADSVRQSLDPDHRFDELRDYTTTHVRAGTAWGKPLQ